MKKLLTISVLALALSFMLAAPQAMALPSFQGFLTSTDGKILTSDAWSELDFKLAWNINQMEDGSWCYEYSLTTDGDPPLALTPAVSHFIIEISPNVTRDDFWGFDGPVELRLPDDDPFKDAPELNSALKLDFGVDGQTVWSFYSTRAPRLSDFVAKGGQSYAWNVGIGDPIDGYELGDYYELGKILAPDTMTGIPEPGTMLLFGLGLVGAGAIRRYRTRR